MLTIVAGRREHEIYTAAPSFACPECLSVFFGTLPKGFTDLGMCEACRSKLPRCDSCNAPSVELADVHFDEGDRAALCPTCVNGIELCRA